ncbi:AbiH family protein [Streptococcus sp. 27098_8_69]|uniref:AbiH family protein n=1 Tax=Streptococcus sp. 27098_8_69 TaxID=3003664 RepID=UPI00352D3590
MADTILILGNGFDIAMGRKTKYEEFIEFTNDLNSRKKYIVNFRKFIKPYKKIKLSNYKDNLYLKFINENRDRLGENWSNLEIMISQLADAIMYFKKNTNVLFKCTGPDYYSLIDDVLEGASNYIAKRYIAKVFDDEFSENEIDSYKKELFIENLNGLFIKHLDFLIELLEIYLSYLDYFDFEVSKIKAKPTALDAVSNISNSSVLNFNYTNTSGHLFGTFEEKTHFIHGRIDLDRTINTMVFGIEDKENDVNSDLIPYQKYYQRVVKETGNKFEEFFIKRNYTVKNTSVAGRAVPTRVLVSKNIVIFGHSVDPLDKEIFQKCFALAESAENGKYDYRFIFTYYDDAAKRSIVKNLAIILGKEKLVELTGKRNVVFVKSDDKKGMEKVLLP